MLADCLGVLQPGRRLGRARLVELVSCKVPREPCHRRFYRPPSVQQSDLTSPGQPWPEFARAARAAGFAAVHALPMRLREDAGAR